MWLTQLNIINRTNHVCTDIAHLLHSLHLLLMEDPGSLVSREDLRISDARKTTICPSVTQTSWACFCQVYTEDAVLHHLNLGSEENYFLNLDLYHKDCTFLLFQALLKSSIFSNTALLFPSLPSTSHATSSF